jgi:hypothetical protein
MTDDWFQPRVLFGVGYPAGISSALRELDEMRRVIRAEIERLGPKALVEIGPGDAPIAEGRPGAVLMDIAAGFLHKLAGPRVQADLFAAPFLPASFDLVVASDVLTHVRPGLRRRALTAMAALGRDMIYFNPGAGTADVAGSPVPQPMVRAFFEDGGYAIGERRFRAVGAQGEYPMWLTTARRS